jgi:tetratricopeptide (TPR) repeat protein
MERDMKRLLPLSLLLLACGCSSLPGDRSNVYELRREAQLAYTGNQDERAEKLLLGLARAVPNDAETWFYLGNLYARTKRPAQAVDAYQKSLMLKTDDAKAWHNLGVVKLREAWAAFIQAYGVVPPEDPLASKLNELISAMEKLPLEGLSRTPRAVAPQEGDAQQ